MGKPNDVRAFVHRRIGRAVGGFISGGPLGAVSGFVQSDRPSSRRGGSPTPRRVQDAFRRGRAAAGIKATSRCRPGQRRVGKFCLDLKAALPGGDPLVSRAGANGRVVAGEFGSGVQPDREVVEVRRCPPGMVLAKSDGLCYLRSDIKNSNREHPRGRRPLGTPGEMAALAKAASFGRRMETTVKRMQRIGVLKRPSRSTRARPQPKLLTPGVVQIQQE